jgi:hypothetical protein
MPGEGRFSLACVANNESFDDIMQRRKSSDDIIEGGSGGDRAQVVYGTLRRRNTGKFSGGGASSPEGGKLPPFFRRGSKGARRQLSDGGGNKDGQFLNRMPSTVQLNHGIRLIRVLKLDNFVSNRWITGLAVTDRLDLIVVDLRGAYLIDLGGNLIRTIACKGHHRLVEPICVTAATDSALIAFSDHADQCVKIFTTKGVHVKTESELGLKNIAGLTFGATSDEILIAGIDRKNVIIYKVPEGKSETILGSPRIPSLFRHPYSIAYNSSTNQVIVGDDSSQSVIAVNRTSGVIAWQFKPGCDTTGEHTRQFFPSAVCCDCVGNVFVADLYNERVYMLDAEGRFLRVLLTQGEGLRGNPGAMATDGRGNLYVADEERTVKVFQMLGSDKGGVTYVNDSKQY